MAVRIRKDGTILCAAKSEAMEGDTYIHDGLHYELSVIQKVLIADVDEEKNGLWHWLHGWCNTSEHPNDVPFGAFVRTERRIR